MTRAEKLGEKHRPGKHAETWRFAGLGALMATIIVNTVAIACGTSAPVAGIGDALIQPVSKSRGNSRCPSILHPRRHDIDLERIYSCRCVFSGFDFLQTSIQILIALVFFGIFWISFSPLISKYTKETKQWHPSSHSRALQPLSPVPRGALARPLPLGLPKPAQTLFSSR